MKKEKPIETITVSSEDYLEDTYDPPSKYYIRDAMGDAVFFMSRSRDKIQQQVDLTYGKNMYTVRAIMKINGR